MKLIEITRENFQEQVIASTCPCGHDGGSRACSRTRMGRLVR
jgi:hypothetical protein